MTRRRLSQTGFSFIEVVIALALFAAAASLIVGLQSSAISRTLRDRNAQQAMLAARRIMASVEAAGSKLEVSNQEDQPLIEVLRALGAPDTSSLDEQSRAQLEKLRVSLLINDWDLPFENVQNPAMKKLVLTVSWGSAVGESFTIEYLFPAPPQPQQGS